jgi:hypothetical protein
MREERYGFSTGALERGDYRAAMDWICQHGVRSVELSALRLEELEPLVSDLDVLPLADFEYVSFHAPSAYPKEAEERVVELLGKVYERGWNIVVHPDVIYTPARWKRFKDSLLIENMDRRKSTGRTVAELAEFFCLLPDARMCLDVAHARQMDTTLTLLWSMISEFSSRIAEVHISELDSHCRHRPLSHAAVKDYRRFADSLRNVPVIIESMLDHHLCGCRSEELNLAREAMQSQCEVGVS